MVYFSKFKVILVLAVVLIGIALSVPNFLPEKTVKDLPSWLPHKQVSLGLDLQGGSHFLLEVGVDSVITERLDSLADTIREALLAEKIRYTGLGVKGQTVQLTVRDLDKQSRAMEIIRKSDNDLVVTGQDGFISVAYSEKAMRDLKSSVVQQSLQVLLTRVDETGTREPTIQRQGEDRILVQLPGINDPEQAKRIFSKTAKMTFHLFHPDAASFRPGDRVPANAILLPSSEKRNGKPVRMYLLRKRVAVSGESLVNAQPTTNRNGQVVVSFRFDSHGAKRFGDITAANVGKPFAIVLDKEVISAPVIREPILGGNGQISGNFTFAEAQELSLLLRAGALPAPLTFLEERSVGPGLGADSIAAGKIASVIGLVLVIVFMVVVYGLFGIFADVALIVNVFLILGALSVLQATLTLPGIAGIVLTIGMAVDANVLVFERIREEVRGGRTPISAIDAGYNRALTTIVDSNLTTFIAALLLFLLGSGPVRGFAVTLSIGIITSMFTAIMLTRLMVVAWLRRARPAAVPI
jgi:preprotein translocase subunit SecD